MGSIEATLLTIAETSFPMLIACYLLFRIERRLDALSKSVIDLHFIISAVTGNPGFKG
jgi:hypothetical protein